MPYGTIKEMKPTWMKYLICLVFVPVAKIKCSYLFYSLKIRINPPSLDGNKHSLLISVYIFKHLEVT